MNKLDHIVNSNINIKGKCYDTIYYNPEFDNKFILSRDYIRYPLPVVTADLIVGNQNKTNIIDGLT